MNVAGYRFVYAAALAAMLAAVAASSLARLQAQPHVLQEIAESGRQWALKHYSPGAMAGRFLETADFPQFAAQS